MLAHTIRRGEKRLIDDPLFAARLAKVEIDLEAMKITNLRMLFQAQKQGAPGPETSMLKIKGTVINQELRDLARRALGPLAAPFPGHVTDGNILLGQRILPLMRQGTLTIERHLSLVDQTKFSAIS